MAVTGTVAQHQVLCLLLCCVMTLSGVTIHAVILSYCDNSSKYSIRGDSEAQQQEVQLQQTTLQS